MWIRDLNIRPETLKPLQEVVGNTLEKGSIRKDFLNRTQKAENLGERMNKWYCIKLKWFCMQKKQSVGSRDSPENGRKSLPAIHAIND
jgi:hypothetical protein